MENAQIKELYYSNGIDVFGPVGMTEFCKNKYYKSTLLWYEGLPGWVSIEDCDDLKHLIGTLSAPTLDSVPASAPGITPPLHNRVQAGTVRKMKNVIVVLAVLAVVLLFFGYMNSRVIPNTNDNNIAQTHKALLDSMAIKEAAIAENTRLQTEMRTYRTNWEKFIMATPNDYRSKEIGGIEDLKIIVKNNSPFAIDSAAVMVEYIKLNGDTHLKETLHFENVPAHGTKELYAPNSNRGVKVQCRIMAVNSGAMNLCFRKGAKSLTPNTIDDPYRCK